MLKRWMKQIICFLITLSVISISFHVCVSSSFFSTHAEEITPTIEIINVQSYPKKGGEWTVRFQVEGTADLQISAIEHTAWSNEECSTCDLKFERLQNKTKIFEPVWKNESILITNFSSSTIIEETSLVQSLGKHVLKFTFGNDTVFAFNDASSWWNNSWGYRKKLSIDHSQVPGSLSNVPVLVTISDEDLNEKAKTDGSDIVFISYQDNTSKYHHEIENYTNGHLTAWVNVTEIFAATDTNLWMYYGNPSSEEQQNLAGVWDTDYVLVYHLNETDLHGTTFDVFDSTNYGNDATTQNMSENNQLLGKIDGSLTFNGTDTYVNTTLLDNAITNAFTINYWFNAKELTGTSNHISIGDCNDNENVRIDMFVNKSNTINCYFGNDTINTTLNSSEAISVDEWYFVTVSYNETHLTLYVNGTKVDAKEIEISLTKNDVMIGSDLIKSNFYNGQIDEVRFLTTHRDQSWITTSYNTMNNQSDFITAGSEESAAPVVSNPFPSDGDNSLPNIPDYVEITVSDPNPDLLNITWRINQSGIWKTFNVTNGSGNGVDDGTYQVTNTSWVTTFDQPYYWSVNVTDGVHWTNETYSFTMHQYNPVINSFNLSNETGCKLNNDTGNLNVKNEYEFTINITDKNGWEDINYINLTSWYDDGDETAQYNDSTGGNLNLFLQYQNISGTSVFQMHWPTIESTLITQNCTEEIVNDSTRIITLAFLPGNQTRCATSNETWDNTIANTFENDYSWNLNCTVTDSMNNKGFYQSEYGVNYYSALRAPTLVEITGAPGMNEQSEVFTIDYMSNADYTLKIYFDENLSQVNGPDVIGIGENLSVLKNADADDDITENTTFSGTKEAHAITILKRRSAPANGLFESVNVQFELYIPFGTRGMYSSQINKKIIRI